MKHHSDWNQEIDPNDHATLGALAAGGMPGGGEGSGGRTLADMIFDKMGGGSAPADFDDGELNDQVLSGDSDV